MKSSGHVWLLTSGEDHFIRGVVGCAWDWPRFRVPPRRRQGGAGKKPPVWAGVVWSQRHPLMHPRWPSLLPRLRGCSLALLPIYSAYQIFSRQPGFEQSLPRVLRYFYGYYSSTRQRPLTVALGKPLLSARIYTGGSLRLFPPLSPYSFYNSSTKYQ